MEVADLEFFFYKWDQARIFSHHSVQKTSGIKSIIYKIQLIILELHKYCLVALESRKHSSYFVKYTLPTTYLESHIFCDHILFFILQWKSCGPWWNWSGLLSKQPCRSWHSKENVFIANEPGTWKRSCSLLTYSSRDHS